MQVPNCTGNFCSIESCPGLTEAALSLQVEEELPPIYIVKDKIKLLRGLEGVMESHKEGVLDIFQEHIAFCHDVVLLLFLQDGLLMQDFHSIKSPITLAFGQENLPKASFANNLQEIKVCWLGIGVS